METLLDNFIKATGWSILHSLWQGALIYALLLPSQLNVFKVKAKVRYALAFSANCLMLLSFMVTFFSVFEWPATQAISTGGYQPVLSPAVSASKITLSQYAEMAFPLLVCLYIAGFLIQSYVVIKGYQKIQTLKKALHQNVPEEWNTLFVILLQKLNLKKQVRFQLSAHVQVPLVLGYMKPLVLFPLALAMQMDIKQVETILIHELSHVRRNDYVLNLIRTMIDTILFFNPFIWLTGRFINIEREHACDDLVVSFTNTPLTYAHALLKLEMLADKQTPELALAATGNNQYLYQRIKRITDMKTNYMNSKQKLFAITLTIATLFSLAWISPAKSEKQHLPLQKTQPGKINNQSVSLSIDTGKKKAKKLQLVKVIKYNGQDSITIVDTLKGLTKVYIKQSPAQIQDLKITLDTLHTSTLLKGVRINQSTNLNTIVVDGVSYQSNLNGTEPLTKIKGKVWKTESDSARNQIKLENVRIYTTDDQIKLEKIKVLDQLTDKQLALVQGLVIKKGTGTNEGQQVLDLKINGANTGVINLNQVKSTMLTGVVIQGNNEKLQVQQSPEYIKLKKKFDKDVEELVNKKLKKKAGQ